MYFAQRVPTATEVQEQLRHRLRNIDEALSSDRQWLTKASDELHNAGMRRLLVRLLAWLRGSTV